MRNKFVYLTSLEHTLFFTPSNILAFNVLNNFKIKLKDICKLSIKFFFNLFSSFNAFRTKQESSSQRLTEH